ncbi:hypothetical protein GCM10028812_37810 [Ancylobacter sonchi]|nr:hypothetical protein [Ancylobacter sonchi]
MYARMLIVFVLSGVVALSVIAAHAPEPSNAAPAPLVVASADAG